MSLMRLISHSKLHLAFEFAVRRSEALGRVIQIAVLNILDSTHWSWHVLIGTDEVIRILQRLLLFFRDRFLG